MHDRVIGVALKLDGRELPAISPLLANLFMHYAFDAWMAREFPAVRFERYCDDVVVHCELRSRRTGSVTRSRPG